MACQRPCVHMGKTSEAHYIPNDGHCLRSNLPTILSHLLRDTQAMHGALLHLPNCCLTSSFWKSHLFKGPKTTFLIKSQSRALFSISLCVYFWNYKCFSLELELWLGGRFWLGLSHFQQSAVAFDGLESLKPSLTFRIDAIVVATTEAIWVYSWQ